MPKKKPVQPKKPANNMTYSNVKKQHTAGKEVSGRRYKTGLGY